MTSALLKGLAALGGLGSRGVALMFALGIALPWLGPVLRPFLTEAIVGMLTVAFLRVRPEALAAIARRPRPVVLATLWMMAATPLLAAPLVALARPADAGLALGVALQVAAPPTMTSAAYAALLGLDAPFGLALLLASMAVTPLASPLGASLVAGAAVPIDVVQLTIRLALIVAGSVAAAVVLRRLIGPDRVERHRRSLDGVTMILLFVFAAAIMDVALWRLFADPAGLTIIFVVVFAIALAMTWVTVALFRALGVDAALTAGLCAGHRNMGVLVAAMGGGALPETTLAFFAMAQFPVYLAPILVGWVARRWKGTR
jgi:BASS family bile acid:Na+ symporter